MYCKKCGKKLEEDSRFCLNCGAQVSEAAGGPDIDMSGTDMPGADIGDTGVIEDVPTASVSGQEPVQRKPGTRKSRKKGIAVAIAAVLVAVIAVLAGSSIFRTPARQLKKQLELGNRYLEEMDYEQAVIAFTKAIEIDPMSVDAHLGLVETYIRQGDFEMALEAAQKGYEMTGDERLKEKIDMIESGEIFDSLGRMMKRTGYDENGNVAWWHIFTYNLKGKEASVTAYDGAGNELEKIEITYDEDGNVINTYGIGMDGHLLLIKNMYEDGYLIRCDRYEDASGSILADYEIYEYDSDGKLTKTERYNEEGVLFAYKVPEYDDNGNKIKQSEYWATEDGFVLRGEPVWEYDDNGNCIRYEDYVWGKLNVYTIYEYDADGTCISEKSYYGDGTLRYEK